MDIQLSLYIFPHHFLFFPVQNRSTDLYIVGLYRGNHRSTSHNSKAECLSLYSNDYRNFYRIEKLWKSIGVINLVFLSYLSIFTIFTILILVFLLLLFIFIFRYPRCPVRPLIHYYVYWTDFAPLMPMYRYK